MVNLHSETAAFWKLAYGKAVNIRAAEVRELLHEWSRDALSSRCNL